MVCKQIKVRNFRNIESAEIDFCPDTNILIGENAQGKTNMIEAIYYTALCRSFRQGSDRDLIRFGCESAEIQNIYSDEYRDMNTKITLYPDRRQKRIQQNGLKISKMSDMVGAFKVVLFCPEHLSVVKEGPSMRRNFLDVAISQIKPLYMKSLQRYQSILKERNTLIKNAEENRDVLDSTIDVWSEQLAQEAARITSYRVEYLRLIRGYVEECFSDMTGKKEFPELEYISSCKLPEDELFDEKRVRDSFLELYSSRHDREICAGATLWGVHKDDVEIKLNGNSARIFCSQGQQRSLALALKLSEGEIIKNMSGGEYPVFLLDDVLSELDAKRRGYLISNLKAKQVIMTTCEGAALESANIIRVNNGIYT